MDTKFVFESMQLFRSYKRPLRMTVVIENLLFSIQPSYYRFKMDICVPKKVLRMKNLQQTCNKEEG